jgi:hypothetical protein
VSWTTWAQAYATTLPGDYLAAVPVAELAKAVAKSAQAVESVRHSQVAEVVGDVEQAAALGQHLEAATVAEGKVGVLAVPWQCEEIEKAAGCRSAPVAEPVQH